MNVLVLLSGGLDSMVVLAECVADSNVEKVKAITFDYGQSSSKEIQCATQLCLDWGVPHAVQKIAMPSGSDTHVEIPGRNSIFLAYALAYAIQHGYDTIAIGAEPDATYTDSSVQFIEASNNLAQLFGVSVIAPVKALADKTSIVLRALDLGVPLHLCHSSRSEAVDGNCKTSERFLRSLLELFPNINPSELLTQLSTLRTKWGHDGGSDYAISYESNRLHSFKLPAALMTLGRPHSLEVVQVYTTGSWGDALVSAAGMVSRAPILHVVHTQELRLLLANVLNTSSVAARWGTLQALSGLPRPRYAPTLGCRVTQGHLADAARSLGYTVVAPNANPRIRLETSV